jgi:hypothetical protein
LQVRVCLLKRIDIVEKEVEGLHGSSFVFLSFALGLFEFTLAELMESEKELVIS